MLQRSCLTTTPYVPRIEGRCLIWHPARAANGTPHAQKHTRRRVPPLLGSAPRLHLCRRGVSERPMSNRHEAKKNAFRKDAHLRDRQFSQNGNAFLRPHHGFRGSARVTRRRAGLRRRARRSGRALGRARTSACRRRRARWFSARDAKGSRRLRSRSRHEAIRASRDPMPIPGRETTTPAREPGEARERLRPVRPVTIPPRT